MRIPPKCAWLLLLLAPGAGAAQDAADSPAAGEGAGFPRGHYAALDALPDWGGIWFLNRRQPGQAAPAPRLQGDYLNRREQWRAEAEANAGVVRRNRSNCSPPGMPRIMQLAQYPYEFLFTPGRVTINQEAWMQTDPTVMGHSIGRWEGDTLVIETVAILGDLEFAAGALHSPEFRVTERIGLSDENPDVLVNALRMEDPQALAEPFELTVTYRRDREATLIEFQCSENDRNPVNAQGETEFD